MLACVEYGLSNQCTKCKDNSKYVTSHNMCCPFTTDFNPSSNSCEPQLRPGNQCKMF